jgi:hypothetical protein
MRIEDLLKTMADDIKSHLKTIEEISNRLYPDIPELAKLCQALMIWERLHMSYVTPRYKEPYETILKGVEDRLQKRLAREKVGEEK